MKGAKESRQQKGSEKGKRKQAEEEKRKGQKKTGGRKAVKREQKKGGRKTSFLAGKLFLQGEKVGRTIFQKELVEAEIGVITAPLSAGFFFQRKDFQIAKIVFQIIAGLARDIGIDGADGGGICNAEALQHFGNLAVGGILIMNHSV